MDGKPGSVGGEPTTHLRADAHPCHLRAELLGAATQKVKPRRVAASEAGAERVSNPRSA
jgi:hypothetical protein